MTRSDRWSADLLTLSAVTAVCPDCADDRILLPVEGTHGEFCCTTCDAAVFLMTFRTEPSHPARSRVA